MKLFFLLCLSILTFNVQAQAKFNAKIYAVHQEAFITFEQLQEQLAMRDMVVIGEIHNQERHHLNQRLILEALAKRVTFNVGLEFVSWNQQMLFDQYQQGRLPLIDFISQVWGEGNYSWDWYKPLVEAAQSSGGWAYGINAPRKLTSKISKQGLDALTEVEQLLMPPQFTLGSDLYKQRFSEAMGGHHVPADVVDKYFAAQSTWDESMAYNALGRMDKELFVIIVGQFHIEYKLGLPARLLARERGLDLATVVQVSSDGQDAQTVIDSISEDENYGQLGDYILIVD